MTAHDYWSQRPVKNVYLDATKPHRRDMAQLVAKAAGKPDPVVLEWGAGAGANLAAILQLLPEASVAGCDINPGMVDAGRQRFGITLVHGDRLDRPGDIAFALSAVCHVQDPVPVLTHLLEMAPTVLLMEPYTGGTGRVTHNQDGSDATPHTYSWPYPNLLRALGAKVTIAKHPLGETGMGPHYRLYTARR